MDQKSRMLAGELYDATDPVLKAAREKARGILREFNAAFGTEATEPRGKLRELLGSAGSDLWIEPPFYCDYGSHIHVGRNVFFNFNCTILDPAEVRIGDGCLFGPNVQIYTATHPMESEVRKTGLEAAKPIRIGDDVWVGGGAIILPGVEIGSGSVIGAGSVVTKSVPAKVFAAGNPCRVIRAL